MVNKEGITLIQKYYSILFTIFKAIFYFFRGKRGSE